jgi:hypothetical protein
MYAPKRLAVTLAAAATLAAAVPAGASAQIPGVPGFAPNPNLCLSGVADPGPFGPSGPYGAYGPYGPDGPLHGTPNPLGDVASCGGLLTFILRGGTIDSFVQANLHPGGN